MEAINSETKNWIVHLGPGAFARAHIFWYTAKANALAGHNWSIAVASLRSTGVVDQLAKQGCTYSLITRGSETSAETIRSIGASIAAAREPERLMTYLTSSDTRIVSLTVTEKAYGIDPEGKIKPDDPSIASDLASPRAPSGVIGILTEALRRRFEQGLPPFTVLCCDNLSENGALVRSGVLDFAARVAPALRDRIAAEVSFPNTMVDRITPASTDATRETAAKLLGGVQDPVAIETEPFSQWVIEDSFPQGRPAWEQAGALFADDVAPFEKMKLRMLNGTHSLLAVCGYHCGFEYVRDVMSDAPMTALIRNHLKAAAATVPPLEQIDLEDYAEQLVERFKNPSIAHSTWQIAMDGSQKLPQRIFAPALQAIETESDFSSFAFATAGWLFHVSATGDRLQDPRAAELSALLDQAGSQDPTRALLSIPGFSPPDLLACANWIERVSHDYSTMRADGMRAAVERFASRLEM